MNHESNKNISSILLSQIWDQPNLLSICLFIFAFLSHINPQSKFWAQQLTLAITAKVPCVWRFIDIDDRFWLLISIEIWEL